MRLLRAWWFWAAVGLLVFLGLAVVFGPKALSLLVAPLTAILSWGATALGADRQTARPGRPRRGGTGGSPTKRPKGVVTTENGTSTPGQDESPAAPARPNRPARPGF